MLAVPAATELVPQKYFNSLIRVPEGTKNIFLLEQSECYPALLQQFTKNVKDFSIFTKLFLNDKAVGEQVNDFLNKISDSKAVDREDQFMLFTDVHPMLHALVNTLKELNCLCPKEIRDKVVAALDNIASTPDEVVSEPAETVSASKQINPECIINILSNSSEGMNLCYEGIKSRLSEALMATTHMITGTENFDVIKQSAKYNVLKQYITLFLARHKIKQRIDFGLYHIHWFNFLYRQICGNYGLPSHPDNFAVRPSNMSDAMLNEFFSQYPLFINESAFLDAITEHFSFKLQEILAKHGKSHWLTDASIQAEEMTLDVITDITNKFFQSCEQLNKGDAWYIFDEKPDGTYTAARHHEKIKALLALEENKDQIKRLDVIQDKEDTKQYIGTKNGIFFWVFNQEDSKVEPLEEVEKCNLLDEGYIPLQLSHLASLNTEKLSADELNTLIIQALNQTNEAKAISTFFLELNGMDLLAKLPLIITVELSELLQNKMDKNPVFKSELCKLLNAHLAGPEIEIPTTETITLLELYLYKMHKDNNGNIAKITKDLDILQIKNFSKASLQKLFNQEDCKRLFDQAYFMQSPEIIEKILLTGYCSDNQVSDALLYAAGRGFLNVLEAAFDVEANIDFQDGDGNTALMMATLNSQSKCVEVLLDRGANTDLQGKRGLTALMIAAYFNKLECIKIFLDRGANIDLKNKNGFTALDYAAIENNFECRKLLLSGLPIFSRLRYMVHQTMEYFFLKII